MTFFVTILPAIILILLSGLFSGLTLGLMALDPYELGRKAKLGNPYAQKVYPIRKRGNELLTALLLGNAAINSALAIFLTSLTTGIVAGLLSTVLIFVFGEVIPQSFISRHAIRFGAAVSPLVSGLLFITYPITKPFGMLLDRVLGHELRTIYSKQELAEIIAEHEDMPNSSIDADEERIIIGALRFSDRCTADIMTPRTVVFCLQLNTVIDTNLINLIKSEGYSRIPVCGQNIDHIEGIINIKDLLGVYDGVVSDFVRPVISVGENVKLDELKNTLLQSHQHIAIVHDEFGGFSGIVTLEDILEEVIGREIMDENDTDADMQEVARKLVQR